MKRVKHHKIKKEKAESSSQHRVQEEHDLAYYIHDRVELMHQVFSILKYKELKSMAPECVRNLAIGDLQELCTEELLGISSKRLLTILDGVEPPSDTESSSPSPPPEQLETISLDSISSDEELLASNSKKKKHKHHRRRSKSKSKKKDKAAPPPDENTELSKASRAGLTVLELLELQARARAIRAQLQQEQANKRPSETATAESSHHSSENEVEIKEEPPDVVEISSEDEKPDVKQLKQAIVEKPSSPKANTEPQKESEIQLNSPKVTKRINDLIITLPQAVPTRKIKLNRNKVTVTTANDSASALTKASSVIIVSENVAEKTVNNANHIPEKPVESKPKKKKKDKKKKVVQKDGSDHDEITLQLSDSEKMDLLEDLDESRKNYDKVSSSSEDTESSSSDSNDDDACDKPQLKQNSLQTKTKENNPNTSTNSPTVITPTANEAELTSVKEIDHSAKTNLESLNISDNNEPEIVTNMQQELNYNTNNTDLSQNSNESSTVENVIVNLRNKECPEDMAIDNEENHNNNQHNDTIVINETTNLAEEQNALTCKTLPEATNSGSTLCVTVVDKTITKDGISSETSPSSTKAEDNSEKVIDIQTIEDIPVLNDDVVSNLGKETQKNCEKTDKSPQKNEHDLSDGEISERPSSEVETIDVQPEVVCISDDEGPKKILNKKKKKKDKKAKKEKKSKKSKSDFREGSDQNFYKDGNLQSDAAEQGLDQSLTNEATTIICDDKPIDLDSDDVYEILELSDDSSGYEVEGTVLSKEPTTEEIEALSAKIDEIEREEVVTDAQIREHEHTMAEKETKTPENDENIGNMSWKDRYLGSKKVKRVLTTANILNALRKKNKDLKKKIQDSKKAEEKEAGTVDDDVPKDDAVLEEGSIEQYNTLQGSTQYVNPIEPVEENKDVGDDKEQSENLVTKASEENNVTREIKKDARQLLKMYKRLLKHNDMYKQKDPNKKKKKKLKKKVKEATESNIVASNPSQVDEGPKETNTEKI